MIRYWTLSKKKHLSIQERWRQIVIVFWAPYANSEWFLTNERSKSSVSCIRNECHPIVQFETILEYRVRSQKETIEKISYVHVKQYNQSNGVKLTSLSSVLFSWMYSSLRAFLLSFTARISATYCSSDSSISI